MSVTTEYRNLLVEYVPQPIHSRQAYLRAMAQLEKLMVPKPGAARSRLIEMLSTLIEDFESGEYPTPQVSGSQMFAHLLKTRGLKCVDVAKKTGIPPATLSNVLANRRGISKANASKLARYFGMSPTSS